MTRLLLENSADRVDIVDCEGRLVDSNALGRRSLRTEQASFGRPWEALWNESDRDAIRAALGRAKQGCEATFEAARLAVQAAPGTAPTKATHQRVSIVPLRDRQGEPVRFVAVSRDDHATHDASETGDAATQLQLSEERLRLAITGAALGTWHWDFRTGKRTWSDLTFALFGLAPRPEMTYEQFLAAIHPSDRARIVDAVARAIREHTDYESEYRVIWPDQSVHWIAARARPYYDEHDTPIRLEGVAQDITARKNAQSALLGSEERYRQLAEAMPHMVWQLGRDGSVIYANPRWVEYFGRTSLLSSDWPAVVHPDDLTRLANAWVERGERGDADIEPFRLRGRDGRYRWFACRSVALRDAEGQLESILSTATDIESLKQTEQALRESRARLDTALRAAGMGTWMWQVDTDKLQPDSSLAQLLSCSPNEARDLTMRECLERTHPDDRSLVRAAALRARDQGGDFDVEFRLLRQSGDYLWINSKGRAEADASGRVLQVFGACMDATQHRHLEEELRQAQKMEAIGQLAGGVAHDFNNLLMVIQGQASLIAGRPDLPTYAAVAIRDVTDAAQRAASLTGQLLAFGRRHRLQVKLLDLNEVVQNIGRMLKRLISENVVLEIVTDPRYVPVCADTNTLAQVLLNLALNARDAMPAGGRLVVRTSLEVLDEHAAQALPEGRPGRWACLSVSDTGAGIPSDVLPHIFEPFFTTKGVGKGTGLGLASVYGIVKQHHGFVSVESSVGQGTTFKTFLPLPTRTTEVGSQPAQLRAEPGRGELVLLVEDDARVRATLSSILEQHNYRWVAADDAVQALELFAARGDEIDLLLTDVVLPRGLSGVELAVQLRYQNQRLRVILCSGYGSDQVEHDAAALPGMTFLQKPYRAEELLTVMRSMLDKARPAARPADVSVRS